MTVERPDEEQRSFQGQRDRELSERRPLTPLEMGRAISYKPARLGGWNLFLAFLGIAILIAVVIINVGI